MVNRVSCLSLPQHRKPLHLDASPRGDKITAVRSPLRYYITLTRAVKLLRHLEIGMPFSSERFLVVVSWIAFIFLCLIFSTSASASTETVLYTFTGTPDGSAPYSPLISDRQGNFYGVTS